MLREVDLCTDTSFNNERVIVPAVAFIQHIDAIFTDESAVRLHSRISELAKRGRRIDWALGWEKLYRQTVEKGTTAVVSRTVNELFDLLLT